MNDNVLYEMLVEKNHIDLIIKALSNYMCAQYEGINLDVVDVPKTMEDIKIAADMQSVLKHQLGTTRHTPKQTSQTTGLIWCKEVFAPQEVDLGDQEVFTLQETLTPQETLEPLQESDEQQQKELNDYAEYAESCLENFLKNHHKEGNSNPSKAWNNVKERHWDTIKRMGEK